MRYFNTIKNKILIALCHVFNNFWTRTRTCLDYRGKKYWSLGTGVTGKIDLEKCVVEVHAWVCDSVGNKYAYFTPNNFSIFLKTNFDFLCSPTTRISLKKDIIFDIAEILLDAAV